MGTQEKSTSDPAKRVKVYRLNADGKWEDQGTGHISIDYWEGSEDPRLFVIDEEDNETLLVHRISSDDIYSKQEDTIISWRDPEFSTELALSFQEIPGCSIIWDNLCNVQRTMHFSSLTNETYNNVNTETRELPPVELSSLSLILKTIVESSSNTALLHLTEQILRDGFFGKLMELFRVCEDLENLDDLHLIFKIIRGIILLNSPQIFEKILGDDLIMDIIGCLEYDPEVPHVHHRNFIKDHVVFKEVIPIKDPVVLSKIHQTYRVGYLKDVILPRAFDDSVVASLNSIILSNNSIVISLLKVDNTFIKELFGKLKSPTTSMESKKTLVHFLHEFCTLSKSLQMVHQVQLFRDLVSEGIFNIIADILQSEDKKLILIGTDILILFLNQDPNILRAHVAQQDGGVLFGLLVKNMLTDFGDDMHCQFVEILRSLLDSLTPGLQRDTIVEMFYEKYLGSIIDVITSSCPSNGGGQIGSSSMSSEGGSLNRPCVKPEILLNISELLCFCVLHHPYRIKCNFLLNNVIDKILYLTRRKEKYLIVAAVKFVRSIISRSDDHLMHHFVKNNLFKPIVDVFVANGDRYNLLNSVVLELFEFIRKENLKILLRYLVDTFWDQLGKFENLSSIHALKVKYEQSLESMGARNTGSLLDQRKRIDERALEREEEVYFNEDSDEEDSTSVQKSQPPVFANGSSHPLPRSGSLVDYDDDEDDEDYKPPVKKTREVSDEDDGVADFRLKRPNVKPVSKMLQRPKKILKTRDGVFAALCSTLSQAVVPVKKAAAAAFDIAQLDADKNSVEQTLEEKGSISSSCQESNEEASPKILNEGFNDTAIDNGQKRDDCTLLPTKSSSSEMAVNGS